MLRETEFKGYFFSPPRDSSRGWGRRTDSIKLPERPVAPLLAEIGRIYMVTENEKKLTALRRWLEPHLPVRGEAVVPLEARGSTNREPAWDNALLVACSKDESLVNAMVGEEGPGALVFGSDVVVWINREPYSNLSRNGRLDGKELQWEVRRLQTVFSEPTTVMWDVALAASRSKCRIVTGTRIIVCYDPLDPLDVKREFEEDIPRALGRNTRIPLIDGDQFRPRIRHIETIPLVGIVDRAGNFPEWHHQCMTSAQQQPSNELIDNCAKAIVGGLPLNRELDSLLSFRCGADNEWRVI